MRRLAITALLLAGIAGCASTPPPPPAPYGNFIGAQTPANLNERLAADTVKQLVALYPPASTRFDLGQPTPDGFGSALVEALRGQGYGLSEFKPETVPARDVTRSGTPGLSLRYLLDAPATTDLYRVTILIGAKSLSRAYVAQNNGVFPAGAWARKE